MCHFFVLTTFCHHLLSVTEQTHGRMESICEIAQGNDHSGIFPNKPREFEHSIWLKSDQNNCLGLVVHFFLQHVFDNVVNNPGLTVSYSFIFTGLFQIKKWLTRSVALLQVSTHWMRLGLTVWVYLLQCRVGLRLGRLGGVPLGMDSSNLYQEIEKCWLRAFRQRTLV